MEIGHRIMTCPRNIVRTWQRSGPTEPSHANTSTNIEKSGRSIIHLSPCTKRIPHLSFQNHHGVIEHMRRTVGEQDVAAPDPQHPRPHCPRRECEEPIQAMLGGEPGPLRASENLGEHRKGARLQGWSHDLSFFFFCLRACAGSL